MLQRFCNSVKNEVRIAGEGVEEGELTLLSTIEIVLANSGNLVHL
jgi:hypothetical protein